MDDVGKIFDVFDDTDDDTFQHELYHAVNGAHKVMYAMERSTVTAAAATAAAYRFSIIIIIVRVNNHNSNTQFALKHFSTTQTITKKMLCVLNQK